eukprot:scaffold2866_cov248-Pinguiococcus_pyrenoidosus.AAC.4
MPPRDANVNSWRDAALQLEVGSRSVLFLLKSSTASASTQNDIPATLGLPAVENHLASGLSADKENAGKDGGKADVSLRAAENFRYSFVQRSSSSLLLRRKAGNPLTVLPQFLSGFLPARSGQPAGFRRVRAAAAPDSGATWSACRQERCIAQSGRALRDLSGGPGGFVGHLPPRRRGPGGNGGLCRDRADAVLGER